MWLRKKTILSDFPWLLFIGRVSAKFEVTKELASRYICMEQEQDKNISKEIEETLSIAWSGIC